MTWKFEFGVSIRLTSKGVNKFLQAFTRRHVPCAMCYQSTHDRHHRRSTVLVRRKVPRMVPRMESNGATPVPIGPAGTMGPQPDLARHQGSRRLVANGVKCMSNYSELSTYHEYGNIFPMSCTVFALQEPEVRTLKQSLETSLRLAKSVE